MADDPAALRDARWVAFFDRAFARFFARHMRALRVAKGGEPPAIPEGAPLVVFSAHPSWWDGVTFLLLGRRLFPGRAGFVPMDAAALAKYGFMRRIGVFGVEQDSPRGAVAFLRTARSVLADPRHMLWITAAGRFHDVRERPLPIAPGLVRLPELAPAASFVPLALEYPFWTERAAEALARFGPLIPGAELAALDRDARAGRLRAALTEAMDALAADAQSRDEGRFTPLTAPKEGMGGVYGLWQRLKALARGQAYDGRHDTRPRKEP